MKLKYLLLFTPIIFVFCGCPKSNNPIEIYSEIDSSATPCKGIKTVTYAGQVYNTVNIGSQCWLKENLNVGDMIPGKQVQTDNEKIEKYCYNDSIENCKKYGGLYQWREALRYNINEKKQDICPLGWHIPSFGEFGTLQSFVNNSRDALLAKGQLTGKDTYGFSALLAGFSGGQDYGFRFLGEYTMFQSSSFNGRNTYILDIYINNNDSFINIGEEMTVTEEKNNTGKSIRCIKDNITI